ncbi:MAG TPA: MATE family efflux transporter [Thermoanaerobaculia bacterium]|nr:MATE family efflux transporter [Thermoanaerobaculia bacterium]
MSKDFFREARLLVALAVPIAAAQAGTQLMGVVDTAVVGRLGTIELGAAGLGNTLFFAIAIVGMGIVMGIDPLISQALGAGDAIRARQMLWQGVWLSLLAGGALMIPMAAAPMLLRRLPIDPQIVSLTTGYLLIRTFSVIPALLFLVVRAYLQARGITRPMIYAMLAGNVFNFVADLLFVFGGARLPWWCFGLRHVPKLGVPGAALATLLGSFVQLGFIAMAVPAFQSAQRFSRKLALSELLRSLRIGVPLGLQWGAEVGIFALVTLFAGELGKLQLAAHQVAISLASFTFTAAVGIGAAGSVRVGRAIGARDQPGTRRAGLAAFAVGGAFMSFCAFLFLIFPAALARILSSEPEVILAAVPLVMIAAVFQISDGIQGVGAGVLRGAGDTRYAFLANVAGHWAVGLPVALFLGFTLHRGIVGMWWGLCAGLSAVAFLLLRRFLRLSRAGIDPLHNSPVA